MRRRLVLSKETLTELRTEELTAVNAAAALPTTPVRTTCVYDLPSQVLNCASIFDPCITWTACTTL